MNPSALIFVALAVAWAVYLIPKALEHHEESLRSRTVSTFSRSIRVLARREPGGKGDRTDLVAAPRKKAAKQRYVEVPVELTPDQLRARRATARRATRRRRNVLALLLLAVVTVAVLAVLGIVERMWVGAPVALLLGWLLACRLMVRKERAVRTVRVPVAADEAPVDDPETGEILAIPDDDAPAAPPAAEAPTADNDAHSEGQWDPVHAPLPTYVSKPAARRTVRTIDLDSTGVWSSGRKAADSALAREAEASERSAKQSAKDRRRATGS